ncbi:MAG TPA: ABC transporter ATP-binding protein [Candidatus Sulfotelmatobacter sp.]|nr:ABC transporter ATP-binding protein [Candidatus Sulfotelmatobacter sp.]
MLRMIKLVKVSKRYDGEGGGVTALAGVSLEIRAGAFVALMGPSGCGKSTLLNLVAGVDVPSDGEVWVDGRSLGALSDSALSDFRRDRIGLVYQFYNLLPTLTALENAALPALLAGMPVRVANARAEERLGLVGMLHRKDHWPHELSGGELQRVAIGRAMVNDPPILLADEPTGNLDSESGRQVLELLARLNSARRATILLATHSPEAAAVAGEVIHLRDGKVEG